ncbi:MAG: transcriptional repressor, partial [Mariprofundaceae bacterium]|nr:transcriptional repressor [Mariprofundaceae bacterium]
KLTAQRQAILDMINQSNQHWDADILARALSDAGHSIGIATIYRGLTALEKAGLVQVIHLGDKKRYERSDKAHHDHLVCRLCGSIEEFLDEDIEERQRHVANEYNFHMDGHQLLIFGICQRCLDMNKKGEL